MIKLCNFGEKNLMFGSVLQIDPSLQQVGIDEQKAFGTSQINEM